jgi:UDP-N-acetylglucosamine--N-acetylmuramyl-(pentapeptide) pyrophosphoryl-undecaprenol N-acetylglucosamine transferase
MINKKKRTIFLVGADTGGHVVPVYALALELEKNSEINVIVIGVGSEIEKKFYSKLSKSKYIKIIAGKSRFGSNWSKFCSYLKLFIGFIQAKFLILKYRPKVIFLKGNYATIPMAFAGKFFKCPVINHESDAVIGKSNKIIARFSKKIFVSYPTDVYRENIKNIAYSGPILREKFTSSDLPTKTDYQSFLFSQNLPIILILGGSLGAKTINRCIFEALEKLLSKFQIIHQTGNSDLAEAKRLKSSLPPDIQKRYYVNSFIEQEFISAIKISDLIISRSGSGIFELAASKKAAILIPYPYASGDHQAKNAKFFSKKLAAKIIADNKLHPSVLLAIIDNLFADRNKIRELSENFKESIKIDGRETVIRELTNYLK